MPMYEMTRPHGGNRGERAEAATLGGGAASHNADFTMKNHRRQAILVCDFLPKGKRKICRRTKKKTSGIFKRNGGAGEVYWDADILNYSNEDFTRNLWLEADKGSSVLRDYVYFDGTEEKSVINNVEILIGVNDDGCYYAEFMYKGVGFLLEADGVTQDEFVSVISSVIR